MGMSASQARLLTITGRMNDVEYKSQQVANIKIRLADESDKVATAYTNALNKQKYTFSTYDKDGNKTSIPLNSKNLRGLGDTIKLVDKSGNFVNLQNMKFSESELYEMINSGEFSLYSPSKDIKTKEDYNNLSESTKGSYIESNGKYWEETSPSSNTMLVEESDSTEFAKAEAEYNAATAKINTKEKKLDQQMKTLDTEHSALKTEYDSVKSLIGDNVEKSFNLFS